MVKRLQRRRKGNILRDDLIDFKGDKSKAEYPEVLRRVVALVEIDGQWAEMTFLTNHLDWSAQTVADLYRCRWEIKVFFNQIQQTLPLADFLRQSAKAVRWHIWIALWV